MIACSHGRCKKPAVETVTGVDRAGAACADHHDQVVKWAAYYTTRAKVRVRPLVQTVDPSPDDGQETLF